MRIKGVNKKSADKAHKDKRKRQQYYKKSPTIAAVDGYS